MAQLYLRQLLLGQDFAMGHPFGSQMQNCVYLVGDRDAKQCLVVDPAWDVTGIERVAESDGLEITGIVATHCHPDHVGGSMFGYSIEGVAQMIERKARPVHVHKAEATDLCQITGVSPEHVVAHSSGDRLTIGAIELTLLHTPGHSRGSQCIRVDKALISGDTLFVEGCGRVDLPTSDPDEMYRTLTERLAKLPGDLMLFPGHAYGDKHGRLDEVRKSNPYLRVKDLATWRRYMAR